ncbi:MULTISPECIES: helix-turn-helix domain-containing protein [Burkholderia]|uniref:AraC family transcriptional regulator n=1 Tax=Burkholderia sola TaxID=2843302 RepID=A0ABV2C914_9BURK|nr:MULTISPECIES: AraC family transcriptional regulator [unclassified Burkholderia]MBP0607654.1 helix-turn-helix transcriptional regulator [Burkholderia sp. CpTa8-5]MBP0717624.1 helix-turn-helix transcriptional regulator [Burkholderia sp. AcTa6-5]
MKHARLDFRNPESRRSMLGDGSVLTSDGLGWDSIYFEHRCADAFETTEHVIDDHYLMVKLNPLSKAERWIGGKLHQETQRRGSTVYVPNGSPHRVRYTSSLGSLNLMALRPAFVADVAYELGVTGFEAFPQFAETEQRLILEASEMLQAEIIDGNPHGSLFADIYARMIAAHVVSRFRRPETVTRQASSALGQTKLKRLDAYIDANLSKPIGLAELSAQLGLSEYYFCRKFKEATGISPYQYVLKKRVEFACTCLSRDDMSIQDIAFASGFGDPVQFSKQFRRLQGIQPSVYRARHAASARSIVSVG